MSVATSRLLAILGVALGALFLWLALRGIEWAGIERALRTARPRYVIPFLASLFLFYWLKAVRWRQLLAPVFATRASALFPSVMIGYAANAILPLQLGEIVRAHLAARRAGVATSATLASIALERVFDLGLILICLPVALATLSGAAEAVGAAGRIIGAAAALFTAGIILLEARTAIFVRLAQGFFFWAPAGARAALERHLVAAAHGLRALRQPRILLSVTVSSVGQWLCMLACLWLSAKAVGIELSWQTAVTLMVLTVIGVSLPTAPGFVGSIQLAFVLSLVPAGVSQEAALAASLFYHALAYASVVLAGLWFLRHAGMGIADLRQIEQKNH